MPTKISKVAKELNVGIKTLFEYLEKKNMPAEHNSPNVRISDEQYDLLMKAFNADHDAKRRAENQAEERKIERKGSQNEANQIKVEELTTQVKKPKILGKIDLNTGKPIGPAEAEQHAAPVQRTPARKRLRNLLKSKRQSTPTRLLLKSTLHPSPRNPLPKNRLSSPSLSSPKSLPNQPKPSLKFSLWRQRPLPSPKNPLPILP